MWHHTSSGEGRRQWQVPHAGTRRAPRAHPRRQASEADIERTLFLYVANGVTTIRGMLGDPRHLVYRERVAKGDVLGPRIYTSGASFSGTTAKTPGAAAAMVIEQQKAGYDLLKIHPGVPREAFDAMAAKADELKMPFAGHVLEANPLTNIANSSRIAGVMVNGRWLSKADIDARLAAGK